MINKESFLIMDLHEPEVKVKGWTCQLNREDLQDWSLIITLISRKDVSASTVKVVSPLPLLDNVPPKEVRVAVVREEAALELA